MTQKRDALDSPAARSGARPGAWLTDAERAPLYLTEGASLSEAIDRFQSDLDLRLVPVVDAVRRPVGALFERDVRRLLLNPFGHALVRNPAFGSSLRRYVRPCPIAEITQPPEALLDHYRAAGGTEGMIFTLGGRLFGIATNRRLLMLAAERERIAARASALRAERIERATERFEAQIATLTGGMNTLARELDNNAGATVDRAVLAGERATAVASAATQTGYNMSEIASRGRDLAGALARIAGSTVDANAAATRAMTLVETGGQRARELLGAAQSIDTVIAMISEIAGQVNLLALNATIEAARAGEAGRGFTVVANEVKQLSNQTGNAARRITHHVHTIRQGIDQVVEANGEVERAVGAMAALSAEVESAVATQEQATRLIARNVDEAVDASAGIHLDMQAIGGTSRGASDSARQMRLLAERLMDGAAGLSRELGAFLEELRAA